MRVGQPKTIEFSRLLVKGKTLIVRMSHCPTDSLLFTRFMWGCLARMGREVKSDMALDPDILHLVLANMENEFMNRHTSSD